MRVLATVEITTVDAWGDDCTVKQAREQGAESALSLLAKACAGSSLTRERASAIAHSIAEKFFPASDDLENFSGLKNEITECLLDNSKSEWRGRIRIAGPTDVEVVILTPTA